MKDGYEEIWEMAWKLQKPIKPLWYDVTGVPRWNEPENQLKPFIRKIKCQNCDQEMNVCLVDPVYFCYLGGHDGDVPLQWDYKDPPIHPRLNMWGTIWWEEGCCSGVSEMSIPEYQFGEENKKFFES